MKIYRARLMGNILLSARPLKMGRRSLRRIIPFDAHPTISPLAEYLSFGPRVVELCRRVADQLVLSWGLARR
jgi:hypothetical protein